MADTDIQTRTKAGFERVAAEFKTVRQEITAGGQATSADKVTYGDQNVAEVLDDLLYKAIAINSFTNTVNTVEMGSTVTDVTLNYSFNKTPKALTLDGTAIDVASTKQTLTKQAITANKTYTLTATDDRNAKATKTTGITFLNGVFFGVGTVGADGVDNAFILGLTKSLASTAKRDYALTLASGEYGFIAYPDRFGDVTSNIGGFDGGMSVIKTLDFTNASGYTESYRVLRTTNAGLGSITIKLK